jgi:TonB-dependent SusC/RagA subfamily outer membrane receptor
MMHVRRRGPGLTLAVAVSAACVPSPRDAQPEPATGVVEARLPSTGAVTSLADTASTAASHSLTIGEYLRGRVPGLQVTTNASGGIRLRLRGAHLRLQGGEVEPLVVIDGLPIASELLSRVLGQMRPSEIRRVDVLRDVASTSVYGMRGAAGVILIRTHAAGS